MGETDDRLDWESLKTHATFPKPKPQVPPPAEPVPPVIPPAPKRSNPLYEPKIGLLDYLSSARKAKKMEAASRHFKEDLQRWEHAKDDLQRQAVDMQRQYEVRRYMIG